MSLFKSFVLLVIYLMVNATSASAALIYHEDFEYSTTNGTQINTLPNWSGAAGWVVRSTGISDSRNPGRIADYIAGDINIDTGDEFAAFATGSNRTVSDTSMNDQTGTIYIGFLAARAEFSTTNFNAAPLTLRVSNSTNLRVDLSGNPSVNSSSHQWVTASTDGYSTFAGLDLGANTADDGDDYLVVARFSKAASANYNRVDLWVNPTTLDETTGFIGFATGDSGVSTIEGIALNSNNHDPSYIDEIRVATTFAEALGGSPVVIIPEPSAFAFLTIGAASMLMRRRRGV